MQDLSELIEYVRENPDDHNARWKLAKKLYGQWEYRIALDHLKKLKEAWPNQQNVIHYLATTYYRMGNYEAAINELEALLKVYPSDASVWRLLARICEAANRPADAKRAYNEVMLHSPSSSIAQKVEQLDAVSESKSVIAEVTEYDEIAPDKTQITCRYCGSPNEAFQRRCIQCHASLAPDDQSKAPKPDQIDQEIEDLAARPARVSNMILLGALVVILVVAAVLFKVLT